MLNSTMDMINGILGWSSVLSSSRGICSSNLFPYPELDGANVLAISAVEVTNLTKEVVRTGDWPAANITNLHFCNVTVTYTHDRWNDTINTQIWLPMDDWNGRFTSPGGGGLVTGMPDFLHPVPVSLGWAAGSSDGGHAPDLSPGPYSWALDRDDQLNYPLLKNFASVALHELSIIGKAMVKAFYGTKPLYSYWLGSSTGGRQGLMMAQQYPDDWDGICAGVPAINWSKFVPYMFWPQLLMNRAGGFPRPCEFSAITNSAYDACDGLDGVEDRVISAPGLCKFDATTLIGQSFDCHGVKATFTKAATEIANQIWEGSAEWYGVPHGAYLADEEHMGLALTKCETPTSTNCEGNYALIAEPWLNYWVLQQPSHDAKTLSIEAYREIAQLSVQKFAHIIDTANPDLSRLALSGTKVLMWHGINDALIPFNGSTEYYNRVLQEDPAARDYIRYFQIPGVGHGLQMNGPYPVDCIEQLMTWVEQDAVPESLTGEVRHPKTREIIGLKTICQYPLVAKYTGGDIHTRDSYTCAETF